MKKTLLVSITAATATATAMLGLAGPAHAFTFGTNGISFDTNQEVKFNFSSSNGAFQSTLKIFEVLSSGAVQSANNGLLFEEVKASDNGSKKGYEATLGNAVQMVNDTFTFLAGKVYALGLASTYNGQDAGIVYTTSSLNRSGLQRSLFGSTGGEEAKAFAGASSFQIGNPFAGPVAIAFEDVKWAAADGDFNDFVVTAEAVPEPLTMGGLALGAAGLAAARRSRKRSTTEA